MVHWEVQARDLERQQQFFANLFGWEIDTNNPMSYGMVPSAGKDTIGGGIGPAQDAGSRVTVYVQVPDINATLDQARRRSAPRRSCRARRTAPSSWRCSAISKATSSGSSRTEHVGRRAIERQEASATATTTAQPTTLYQRKPIDDPSHTATTAACASDHRDERGRAAHAAREEADQEHAEHRPVEDRSEDVDRLDQVLEQRRADGEARRRARPRRR